MIIIAPSPTSRITTKTETVPAPIAQLLCLRRLSELYFHVAAVFLRHFEQVTPLKMHEAGNEYVRELLDTNVIGIDVIVEELAPVGDLFLEVGDAALKLHEIVVGLELRIVLGHGEERLEGASDHIVGLRLLAHRRRLGVHVARL